ncbi:MAG: alpha-amylase [Bacteroidales bacterium]|nr:alpha-amylase [Bacteroidales bacterium]
MFEFHIAKQVREKYQLEETLFATDGNVIFADFIAVRQFVHRVNQMREPEQHIYPGEVNAAGLIDEIFHLVLREYEANVNKDVFEKAVKAIGGKIGEKAFNGLLEDFIEKFPPAPVYNGEQTAKQYLQGQTSERSNAAIAVEEAMMLILANFNPANKKLKEFFDEEYLSEPKIFRRFADALSEFIAKEPPFGPKNQDVFTLLKTPLQAASADLFAQLEYILENWKSILPEKILVRVLKGKDLMKEDVQMGGGFGEAPTIVPTYEAGDASFNVPTYKAGDTSFTLGKSGYQFANDAAKDYEEYENFTTDTHWMPRVVLLAKNTYVWLDQLSKKYQREIRLLNQVPDEELDQIARWNFNGLWLIGIWERSEASKRIKHIMGNTDAVSSAYSLYDYEIAADLGGEQAYQNLNERAKTRGIRLASDMVPNHSGIFSKWVLENPDYFIQSQQPPFPAYRFTGENLSQHPDIEIRIDDGYYSKSDAAVVFQRIDKRFADVRYIYHGNDGTNMPWNDTAQLDMLKHEVREAVINKIFDVACRFSIIRFDAAMTLAKKHFSRLWYPRPGSGGDIPSRTDYAMSEDEFDALFPVEFWREVVDRMNNEMPETLLLAEAFWMMEGYFVRTLGMHRVYNSAFMHMLKNEENEKYRDLITNTLEFEPEILKRYVNFMSNPDEETAIRQFGSDDKYFGVCVLMSTLPGLPMFAHGQIEGYTEKYGMEYQRAYYNEEPNRWLVERHEREIFPLTQKRYVFSEVDQFNIFDFVADHGHVNENVFAYTNRSGNDRALVLFNNKYEATTGQIHTSAPKLTKQGADKIAVTVNLGEALSINPDTKFYCIFREHVSGLEFLRSGHEINQNGFGWGLQGFEYRVFMDFREVFDESGVYEKLCDELNGKGVQSIDSLIEESRLKNVHEAFEHLLADDLINYIIDELINPKEENNSLPDPDFIIQRHKYFADQVKSKLSEESVKQFSTETFTGSLNALQNTFELVHTKKELHADYFSKTQVNSLDEMLVVGSRNLYRENVNILVAYFAIESLQEISGISDKLHLINGLLLDKPLQNLLKRTGRGEKDIALDITLIKLLLKHETGLFFPGPAELKNVSGIQEKPVSGFLQMLDDAHVKEFIGVNLYQDVWYYSKENFEELVGWVFSLGLFKYMAEASKDNRDDSSLKDGIVRALDISLLLKENSEKSGYEFEKLRNLIRRNITT